MDVPDVGAAWSGGQDRRRRMRLARCRRARDRHSQVAELVDLGLAVQRLARVSVPAPRDHLTVVAAEVRREMLDALDVLLVERLRQVRCPIVGTDHDRPAAKGPLVPQRLVDGAQQVELVHAVGHGLGQFDPLVGDVRKRPGRWWRRRRASHHRCPGSAERIPPRRVPERVHPPAAVHRRLGHLPPAGRRASRGLHARVELLARFQRVRLGFVRRLHLEVPAFARHLVGDDRHDPVA